MSGVRGRRPWQRLVWSLLALVALGSLISCRHSAVTTAGGTSAGPATVGAAPPARASGPPPRSAAIPADAVALVENLEQRFSSDAEALFVRGLIVDLFGQTNEAAWCWEQCLALEPKFALARQQLGLKALDRGDFDAAVAHLDEASFYGPKLPEAKLHLGKALLKLGRSQEATAVLQLQTAEHSGSSEAWFYLGQACLQSEDFARAKACYQKASEINPALPLAWFGRSQACERLGDAAGARESLRQFQLLEEQRDQTARAAGPSGVKPEDQALAQALAIAGDFYRERGQPSEAEAHYRRALVLRPDHPDAAAGLAKCCLAAGTNLSEARRLAEVAVRGRPTAENYFTLGGLCLANRDEAGAQAALAAARRLDPANPKYQEAPDGRN
jgi:tetratricopeptide (TPR) repeat protein